MLWHPWELEFLFLAGSLSHQPRVMTMELSISLKPVCDRSPDQMSLLTDCSGHIKYPDLRNGLPANEVDRELSVIPTLLPGEVTPGSPVDDIIDIINAVYGTRSPNYARTQSRPNTKDKASTRPRRDDRNVFGTDNGNWTKISATIDSNITARDHTLSPEQTLAPSHLPQDLTNELQGRSRYPITSGGFGDIWKCELVKPDGTVRVCPASSTSYSCY